VVHAQPRQVAGRRRHQQAAGALDAGGEGDVVDHAVADGGVAADPAVEAALDQQVAAGRDGHRAAARSGQRPRRDECADGRGGGRQHRALGGALGDDRGEEGHAAPAEAQGHGEGAAERVGRVHDVGVREQQPLPARGPHPLPAGPGLADPARREGLAREHPHPGVAARRREGGGPGAVARLVVDHDHLERGVLERAQAADRRADPALLVARGDDHAHGRPLAQGRLVPGPGRGPALVEGQRRGGGPDRGRHAGGEGQGARAAGVRGAAGLR
jgi:hypothetical protein